MRSARIWTSRPKNRPQPEFRPATRRTQRAGHLATWIYSRKPGNNSAFVEGILVPSLSILYIEWTRVKSPTLGRIVYVARRPDRCRWLAASEERTFGLILFDAVTFREGHQITWFPG